MIKLMNKLLSLAITAIFSLSFSSVIGSTISNITIETVAADSNETNGIDTKGVSVSPAHFHLNMKPGQVKSYKIKVNNDTEGKQEFKVTSYDFNMNGKGKSAFIAPGTGKYSLSKWMNISPTFFEINPGETKEISFTISIPNDSTGNRAAWSIIMIEQAKPRTELAPAQRGSGTVALGVVPTYAFGVFVYQNPPTVKTENVEITDFRMETKENVNTVFIEAENLGDGIAYCTSYIDLINNKTGAQVRLTVKKFTIVPGLIRDFVFKMPALVPGQYTAIGVLDYEGSEEIQAAKMQITIK